MSKRLIALLAGVLAIALVVGCGGGDDDEATASSITKAEFIKQADAVCEKTTKQAQADFRAYLKEGARIEEEELSAEDYAAIVVETVMTPNYEQEFEELRDLGAPNGDEDEVEKLIVAREEDLEAAQAEPERFARESEKVFAQSSKLAKEYGLQACDKR